MNNLKIGTRLAISFGAVICMMIFVAAISISRLNAGSATLGKVINSTYAKVELVNKIKNTSDLIARTLRNAMLAATPEDRTKFINAIDDSAKTSQDLTAKLGAILTLPEDHALFDGMNEALAKYVVERNTVITLINQGRKDEATDFLFKRILPVYSNYNAAVEKMIDFQQKQMSEDGKQAQHDAGFAIMIVIALTIAATVLASFLGWLITRSIVRPMKNAVFVARTVAAGNLTSHIDASAKDETGQLMTALNDMNNNLLKLVTQVRLGSDAIATASSQIATGNLDLSSRTEEQASALEETASSMEEMTCTVKQNADNARQANQLAASASDAATKGGNVVGQVVQTMGSIKDSSHKIVDIISVIDGIAFQTNILALNAAVEAARAGEQGRGFAVVAAEVRNLAQRSAAAAKEIKSLIGDSVDKVDMGSRLVDDAGNTMTEIVDSIKRVTDVMGEITAASQEQTAGIEQINQAITQMDQVTQQNAALVEEAAAAAASLQDQASNLSEVISVFQLDERHAMASVDAYRTHRMPERPAIKHDVRSHGSAPRPPHKLANTRLVERLS